MLGNSQVMSATTVPTMTKQESCLSCSAAPMKPAGRGAKSGGQNPGYGFWTRKTTHLRGAKSREQNPGSKIRATDFGLGNPLTHGRQNLESKIRGNGFCTRKTTHAPGAKSFGLGKPLTHRGAKSAEQNPGRQNPGNGFWTWKTTHPCGAKSRVAKSGGQNSGQRIWNSEIQTLTFIM